MNRPSQQKTLRISGHHASVTFVEAGLSKSLVPRPTILALHGFTGSARDFRPLWETQRGTSCNWICLDFMGHGKSASPVDPEPYSLDNALTLIHQARQLAPNPDRVILLAYSMGGRIAMHYLTRFPPLPAYLIGASPGLTSDVARAERRIQDQKWIELLEQAASIHPFCDAWEAQPLIARQKRLPEPFCSQMAERRRRNHPTGLANSLRACGTGALESLWQQLPELPPVYLIHGEQDEKFAGIANRMSGLSPSCRPIPIPGCGHAPHLEDPDALMNVLDF